MRGQHTCPQNIYQGPYESTTGTATGTSKNNRSYEQIKQQLCTRAHHTFSYIPLPSLHNFEVK